MMMETPSHLAVENDNFDVARLFMEGGFALGLRNKKGILTSDFLGSADDLPYKVLCGCSFFFYQFQRFLRKRVDVAAQIFGFLTMCDIPTSEIKDYYISTISCTAALLATITFTVAFTVPGGFNSQDGTIILEKKVAFRVFVISDIAVMCLSMMVFFSLLWIMAEKVVLVDFSLFLLQASFYATLLTFMTSALVTNI
ncbi:hypothetical protein Cgig2_019022 [Carnegiea gigantea]|uniref:PGG domain-containing protein n=1 Tax=Carnegiea gigantea TaxID=171969 RepID=A0A9Q1Q4J4_9CARY|nr:hypothetical protein Cgig2_019022 [Carnegiea gigantea]